RAESGRRPPRGELAGDRARRVRHRARHRDPRRDREAAGEPGVACALPAPRVPLPGEGTENRRKQEAGSRKRTHMKLTDIIRRPLVTEKTTLLREDARTVVFEVAVGATKIDIKRAVEKLLGIKVEGVRTAIGHGKFKRQGRFMGQRSDWKKAYVKLRDCEKIPVFLEGA